MKKYRYVLFLGFFAVLAAGVVSGAERPVSVTASVDKDKVNIGDRVKLTVAVPQAAGFELEFPEAPQNLGDFSFIGSRPVKSRLGISSKTGRAYVMGIYSTGTHVIPPIEVKYRKPGDNEWQSAESPQVPIEVESLLTGEYSDIRDIKGPFFP
ncbi:MAG: BatD family protein, partial [Candidatus Omnitrophota bacterium]